MRESLVGKKILKFKMHFYFFLLFSFFGTINMILVMGWDFCIQLLNFSNQVFYSAFEVYTSSFIAAILCYQLFKKHLGSIYAPYLFLGLSTGFWAIFFTILSDAIIKNYLIYKFPEIFNAFLAPFFGAILGISMGLGLISIFAGFFASIVLWLIKARHLD